MRKRIIIVLCCLVQTIFASAQSEGYRTVFTPYFSVGGAFNLDFNVPAFSGSLRLMGHVGTVNDFFNINVGLGYRGFFDLEPPREFIENPSFSDWMLYTNDDDYRNEVRPMGGQIIIPAEVMVNFVKIGRNTALFLGIGGEYGFKLYQSHRYGRHYGAHIMSNSSQAFYPMIGIKGDTDDGSFVASLYMRRYVKNCFNKELDIDKFNGKNYFGFQLSFVL